MIEHVELLLLIFIYFYFFILLYDFGVLVRKKNEKKRNENKRKRIFKLINNSDNSNNLKKLERYLRNVNNLYSLCSLMEEDNSNIVTVLNEPKFNSVFISLMYTYKRKSTIERAYFSYVLSYIVIDDERVIEFLKKCLYDKSVYSTENSLNALYKIGNVDSIIAAYRIISNNNLPYNHRLLTDGMNNITHIDLDYFYKKIVENFYYFNSELKIGLVNYFREKKYTLCKELIYKDLLENRQEKEITIAMIRYFTKIQYVDAYKLFIERLNTNFYKDFEYDVVMIQTLRNYDSKETLLLLTKLLKSSNYYVRLNSAKVLKHLVKDLREIDIQDDNFAKDMLIYMMSQEG